MKNAGTAEIIPHNIKIRCGKLAFRLSLVWFIVAIPELLKQISQRNSRCNCRTCWMCDIIALELKNCNTLHTSISRGHFYVNLIKGTKGGTRGGGYLKNRGSLLLRHLWSVVEGVCDWESWLCAEFHLGALIPRENMKQCQPADHRWMPSTILVPDT